MNSSSSGSASRSCRRSCTGARSRRRIAAKHTVDVDTAQPEDIAHAHLRGDRSQIRLDLVEDRPLALGVQVAQVERELVAARGIDHDHLRLRVRVQVHARLVEELAGQRHPLGIDVADDRDDRRVRDAVRRAGRSQEGITPWRQGRIDSSGTESSLTDGGPPSAPGSGRTPHRSRTGPATKARATNMRWKLCRGADPLGTPRRTTGHAAPPAPDRRPPAHPPARDALQLHRPRDRRRAEPDRNRPVRLQVRPHRRAFGRRDTERHRPAVRRYLRPPPARELGPHVPVARGDPDGDTAVDEVDQSRIEHGRQPQLVEKRNLHPRRPVACHRSRSQRASGTTRHPLRCPIAAVPRRSGSWLAGSKRIGRGCSHAIAPALTGTQGGE